MKKLLVAVVLLGSTVAFGAEDVLSFASAYSFNCNAAKIFCYCPTGGAFRRVVKKEKLCKDGKKISFKTTEIEKSFSDGGDQMNCSYTVSYVCK